MPVVTTA